MLAKLSSLIVFTGLFLIISLVLFPAGWGSEKVQYDCGKTAAPFSVSYMLGTV